MKKPGRRIRLVLARDTLRVLRAELPRIAGGFSDPETADGNGPCTFNVSGCATGRCPSINICLPVE